MNTTIQLLVSGEQPRLTRSDLDRSLTPEEAERLPLRCHEEDCFVHGSEWGLSPEEITANFAPTFPSTFRE